MDGALEHDLVARCLAGETNAFEALYTTHAGRVKGYFLRSGFTDGDAEDLTQQAFVRAYKSLRTFDAERGSFRTWLGAITRNVARRQWRKAPGADLLDPELAEVMFADDRSPHTDTEAREALGALDSCLGRLETDLSTMVQLRYVEGLTTRGMAERTGMPESTVRLRLGQAFEHLRRCMESKGFLSDDEDEKL